MTRVKICGLTKQEDAELALALGADELGFILEPTSPRFVQAIPSWLTPGVRAFAVFGPLPPLLPEISNMGLQFIPDWSEPLPLFEGKKVRPVLRPKADTDWGQVKERLAEAGLDEIILDPYHPDSYGGTGKTLDDASVEKAQTLLMVKLVIAGGLTPQNVADVIRRHSPFGVDVASGVESSPGIKDHQKLREFLLQAGKKPE